MYLLTSAWFNLKDYLTAEYYHWVLAYTLGAGIVSFGVIYRQDATSTITNIVTSTTPGWAHPRTLAPST